MVDSLDCFCCSPSLIFIFVYGEILHLWRKTSKTNKHIHCFPQSLKKDLNFAVLGAFGAAVVGETIALQLFTGRFQFSHQSINTVPINYQLIKANIVNMLSVAIYYPQSGSFSKCLVSNFMEVGGKKRKRKSAYCFAAGLEDDRQIAANFQLHLKLEKKIIKMIKNLLKAHLHLGDNSIRFNRVRGEKKSLTDKYTHN